MKSFNSKLFITLLLICTMIFSATQFCFAATADEEYESPDFHATWDIELTVTFNGRALEEGEEITVDENSRLVLTATSTNPENGVKNISYMWRGLSSAVLLENTTTTTIPIPSNIPETGVELGVAATAENDKGSWNKYFKVYGPKAEPDPGGHLIIPPWMILNENAEGLLVSLRNDSEQEKANKNFYKINEEVIYYVDYKNYGDDITEEVDLVLYLPLKFTVVDADGGTVDTTEGTITWTYPHGLKSGAEDTKVVKVKYTSLSKKSYNSEMIYPQAVIYNDGVAEDYSAVINCIYIDEDTELDVEHIPYMYGDLEAPTFRPDDDITRAEGSMVLLRIFNEDYLKVRNITTRYTDLDETYYVAQQAITKATELNVMSGYPNKKFRPNGSMTRAEFMRVIASYISETAKVKGLEIKDEKNSITVYRNPKGVNHWSNPYVTLLVRLNMTPVSEREMDLRVDDNILRCEVAQLCNYYLFRCPAKMTSRIEMQFIDVYRTHKLVADIVEATYDSHYFTVTDDGREIYK